MGANASVQAPSQLMFGLEAGAAKAASATADPNEHPADTQMRAAISGVQGHFLNSFGLAPRVRVDAIHPPRPQGSSFLVVVDLRHAFPDAEGGGIPPPVDNGSPAGSAVLSHSALKSPSVGSRSVTTPVNAKPTITHRAALKSAITSAAMSIARCLENHRGTVAVQPIASAREEPLTADEAATLLSVRLEAACALASPNVRALASPADFRAARESDPHSVLVLPPAVVGVCDTVEITEVPHSLVATVAPHVDVIVYDAPAAVYDPHEAIGRLPAAVGRVCLGYSATLEFASLAKVLCPTIGSGTRILIAGLVTTVKGAHVPFLDHVGRSESRLDHLCCLFDVIVLVGHPPLSDPGNISNFQDAAERRGVTVLRALDCAVPNRTGQVVDRTVGVDDPWPVGPDVLGLGSRTVAMLRTLIANETQRAGSVNLTILGSWTLGSPCEGLRDVVMACHTSSNASTAQPSPSSSALVPVSLIGAAPQKSRVTIVSDSDYMTLRLSTHPDAPVQQQQPTEGTSAEAPQPVTLAKLPFDFSAEFSRITIPSGRIALTLCGVAPTQLVNFPESPGLTQPSSTGNA